MRPALRYHVILVVVDACNYCGLFATLMLFIPVEDGKMKHTKGT